LKLTSVASLETFELKLTAKTETTASNDIPRIKEWLSELANRGHEAKLYNN
jgi:hypothetical protein